MQRINNELNEICNWFKANKLSANASKTNYMVMGTSHTTCKYIDITTYTIRKCNDGFSDEADSTFTDE